MSPSDHERDGQLVPDPIDLGGQAVRDWMESEVIGDETTWLQEIIAQLENDPGECWLAMESLSAIDPEMRRAIIGELSGHRSKPGVQTLLSLLATTHDPDTRSAARLAYDQVDQVELPAPGAGVSLDVYAGREALELDIPAIEVVNGLITPVNGMGRATVVVSIRQAGQRRTAAFLCDVCKGILDVVGEVESESPSAGRLIEDWLERTGGDCAHDFPSLALILLKGSLLLCGVEAPGHVRDWVAGMLGPGFEPSGAPGVIPMPTTTSIPGEEMARRVDEILDACPSWLDTSGLTVGLAEEISMREGTSTPTRFVMRVLIASCSNTCSSTSWSCIAGCSCGWAGSGEDRGERNSRDRRSPWLSSSPTSNTKSRHIPSRSRSRREASWRPRPGFGPMEMPEES